MKIIILVLSIAMSLILLSAQTYSQEFSPVPTPVLIQSDKEGLAIGGYDPVAYFDKNSAIVGKPQYSCEYLGKTWHFSSEENRDRFLESPEHFTPEYGGYCAHSVGNNSLVEADPESFLVRDDKLYFYANDSFRDREENKSAIDFGELNSNRGINWSEIKFDF